MVGIGRILNDSIGYVLQVDTSLLSYGENKSRLKSIHYLPYNQQNGH